ncbi:hypothetical protein JN11_04053 [Mucilaginibacter frigoritolerans]|uniref:Uncharacterized protein n=1 Tax=Mucilaginibacter frigoritolerans TaxID=652788 RepID=A0A562TRU4_9SPHI|nr:hypothetical protein [Mucilaginibacter frigoritolerans]TWI96319.1 hypothetical protein JN11_04053 [Mucilaginibacter frigoritolerans]
MKNAFKLPLLALAISLSVMACKGNKSGGAADSAKVDSSSSSVTKSDTTVKVDTVKPATDTSKAKVDTVSKTVTKATDVKKSAVKKEPK